MITPSPVEGISAIAPLCSDNTHRTCLWGVLCCLETTHLRSVRHKTPEGRNQMLVRAWWRALHSLSPLKPQPSSPAPSGCWWPPSLLSTPFQRSTSPSHHPIPSPKPRRERGSERMGTNAELLAPCFSRGVYLSPLLSHSSNVYHTFPLHLSFMKIV